ncbi:protein-export chaperone SecB [Rhodovulum adriaticum]|uniref:Protein-export protein SecB n=1 Tax=Rhodovulum adriaticum TaxID=35804 RepID=A0A4V2SMJ4_RHOAD|nr:protein-export chaperone SecB [Rhodovulum adriaticum]MBK1634874.1 protein-export chaperone SecB [Rhodovulum adriaticum]TCP27546.1 protein translocase subunit secB [Rhodovulum adriaticum]
MSETEPKGAAEQQSQVKLRIVTQFIRDLSFENIAAQKNLQGDVTPELAVEIGMDVRKRPTDDQYEIVNKYKVSSKNKADGTPIFLLEVDYAGIFHVENVPEDQLHPFLLIECPRMLFPYVRRIVSDMTRDGGFPPVNLEPVDFVALYRQEILRRAQQQQQQQQPSGNV